MKLKSEIEEIRVAIQNGHFRNEASVSQGVVFRLLSALNWPIYDTQIVCPEYGLEGKRVDYALCHPKGKPVVFIEVKNIGSSDNAERQLFEYAFHEGVPFAILTDGQIWNFFLPAGQGDYAERRIYRLDIVERDVDECVLRLNRYLEHNAVTSGNAIKVAHEDYHDASRKRQIQVALPQAWKKLVESEDELLLELIAEQVGNICGYEPDNDIVASFLSEIISTSSTLEPERINPKSHVRRMKIDIPPDNPQRSVFSFVLNGKHYGANSGVDLLAKIFETLTEQDSSFPERFAALHRHGTTRRYLAPRPEDIFPHRPDMVRDYTRKLKFGWWMLTNNSLPGTRQIIKMACRVANVKYNDLQVKCGD